MKYKVYTGAFAKNNSVNISCHGTFEAKDDNEARKMCLFNVEHQNLSSWQFPVKQNSKTMQYEKINYIQPIHDNIGRNPFVCKEEDSPLEKNVLWKSKKAIISYYGNEAVL